jgi:hypothetical protein
MSDRKDGGPAFPASTWDNEFDKVVDQTNGMTLRDYFAAKAMPQFISLFGLDSRNSDLAEEIARISYRMADALLSEREGGSQ